MTTAKPLQRFTFSHRTESDFAAGGLRSYARYRDLGIAAATDGRAVAHVIRFLPPCTDEVRQWHRHDVEIRVHQELRQKERLCSQTRTSGKEPCHRTGTPRQQG